MARPTWASSGRAHGPSVQQAVEEAAESVVGHPVTLHAAGRTDAGVHARAMRAHFDCEKPLPPFRMGEALNAKLRAAGEAVAVLDCVHVAPDWHARFSCTGRAYEYVIANRRAPLVLEAARAWRIAAPLDADAMHEAAQVLVGHHDFTTFPFGPLPVRQPGEDAGPALRAARDRSCDHRGGGAQLSASSGTLDGRLPRFGG